MKKSGIDNLIDLIEKIEVTEENKEQIKQIKNMIEKADYTKAISILNQLRQEGKIKLKNFSLIDEIKEEEADEELFKEDIVPKDIEERNQKEDDSIYPKELCDEELEEIYIGLLLENPKAISMYYILHEDCYFKSDKLLNLYKSVLFTEGQAYAPQIAKNEFNFAKEGPETYQQKICRIKKII